MKRFFSIITKTIVTFVLVGFVILNIPQKAKPVGPPLNGIGEIMGGIGDIVQNSPVYNNTTKVCHKYTTCPDGSMLTGIGEKWICEALGNEVCSPEPCNATAPQCP